jgi:hypothetical protein
MSNVIYPLAKQRLLEWVLDSTVPADGADVKVIGVDSTYVYSAGHEDLTDVPGGSIVAPATTLQSVTRTLGVLDAENATLESMLTGETLTAFIVYAEWATATLLLCYMDTPGDGTIPATIDSETGLLVFDVTGILQL